MAIPILIGGAALASGVYGAYKTWSGKGDMDRAKELTENANRLSEETRKTVTEYQDKSKDALENLGRKKIEILSSSVNYFLTDYARLSRKFDMSMTNKAVNVREMDEIANLSFKAKELESSAGATGIAAGALTAFGAYGAGAALAIGAEIIAADAFVFGTVGSLTEAAVLMGGTAIAGASTALLASIVAGPALAIGGTVFANKAKKSLEEAEKNYTEVWKAAKEANKICNNMNETADRAWKFHNLLDDFNGVFKPYVIKLHAIVQNNPAKLSADEEDDVARTLEIMLEMKKIIEVPLFDKDGNLLDSALYTLNSGNLRVSDFKAGKFQTIKPRDNTTNNVNKANNEKTGFSRFMDEANNSSSGNMEMSF